MVIGFFCVVSAAKRNWRRLFIVIWAEAVCSLRGQTATNLRWSRYRSNYIITKLIIPDIRKISELVVKLQINWVTSRWNGTVSDGLLRNHSPYDSQGLRQNKFLSYPWEKSQRDHGYLPAGEKIPVIPTHEVKVLQLFVCYTPTRRGVIKNNPRIYHSLGTGLSGSSDSRTSWCRQ